MPADVHCINLDHHTDRMAEFIRLNGSFITCERFPAIDGHTLSIPQLIQNNIFDERVVPNYAIGEIGCALSHRELWLRCVKENRELTICEDDAIFNHEFTRIKDEVTSSLNNDFDIILWGWNFDFPLFGFLPSKISRCSILLDQDVMRQSVDDFRKSTIKPSALMLQGSMGLTCYTLSPKGAKKLLEKCFPLKPLTINYPIMVHDIQNCGIDIAACSVYESIDAFASFPPAVITLNYKSQ